MALKDWKKIGRNHWENKLEDEYEIKVIMSVVQILSPNDSNYKLSKWKVRKFKTKSQALKYAKAYMRKH